VTEGSLAIAGDPRSQSSDVMNRAGGFRGTVLATMLALSGCDCASRSGQTDIEVHPTTTHPTSTSLDREGATLVTRSGEATGSVRSDIDMLRSLGGNTSFTIGIEEGGADEVLGTVAAAVSLADNRIAILDGSPPRIRVYTANGEPSYSIGGPGVGPGEFRAPLTMVVDPESQALTVVDRDRRISTFADTLLTASVTISVDAEDACIVGPYLVLSAFDPEEFTSVQRHDLQTGAVARFGEAYPDGPPIAVGVLTGGAIACSAAHGQILVSDIYLPFVMSYSVDGQLQWTAQIEDFVPREIVSGTRDDGRAYVSQTYLDDFIANLVVLPSGNVLVQVGHSTVESSQRGRPYDALMSYVLDHQSGVGAYVSAEIPWVEYASSNRVLTLRQLPYPVLSVHDVTRSE